MSSQAAERFITKLLSYGAFFTTIFVAAWWTTEPVNAPKMVVLSVVASACLAVLILQISSWVHTVDTKVIFTCGLFAFWSILSSVFSSEPFAMNFYGVAGRNTGLLTYISLTIIFLGALFIKSKSQIDSIIKGFLFAGLFNTIYCLFTIFGVELLPWNNIFNTILGTFGNPDFISAFLGMFLVAIFTKTVSSDTSFTFRFLYIFIMIIDLIEIKKSHAIQGLAVSVIGIGYVIWLRIRSITKSKLIEWFYLGVSAVLGLCAVLGALQIGPLTKLIYKTSISLRGQYWLAGWHMGVTHPIFGVGLDGYGSWYRRARAAQSLITPGVDTTSNAAHNVYIDMFASGGFPLVIAYVVLSAIVIRSIIKLIGRSRDFDLTGVLLSAVWICYQAQSVISINQIGLAIWGWIFGALVIAYETASRKSNQLTKEMKRLKKWPRNSLKQVSEPGLVLGVIFGALGGLLIALPPSFVDAKWRTAVGSGDAKIVEEAARAWPLDPIRLNEGVKIFMDNKYPDKGRQLTDLAIEKFPNGFISWYTYSQMPNLTDIEKKLIKENLHRLDPLNPKYK